MSMKLARRTLFPSHAQVHIGDFESTNVPEWSDQEYAKGVIAGADYIMVFTRDDLDGHVVVDIRAEESGRFVGHTVFDGTLSIPSGVMSVRSATDNPHPTVIMPSAGEWRVIISIDPKHDARHVTLQIPDYSHPDAPSDDSWLWS